MSIMVCNAPSAPKVTFSLSLFAFVVCFHASLKRRVFGIRTVLLFVDCVTLVHQNTGCMCQCQS